MNTVTLTKAHGHITSTKNCAADDTFLVGSRTYTLKASPSAAYEVDVGTDEATTLANLVKAINGTGTAGSEYAADTLPVPGMIATTDGGHIITLTARFGGEWGNSLKVVEGTDSGTAYAVTAFSGGAGNISGTDGWVEALIEGNQINSEVLAELKKLTEASD
jgi:phage tail sheath gpL-like